MRRKSSVLPQQALALVNSDLTSAGWRNRWRRRCHIGRNQLEHIHQGGIPAGSVQTARPSQELAECRAHFRPERDLGGGARSVDAARGRAASAGP